MWTKLEIVLSLDHFFGDGLSSLSFLFPPNVKVCVLDLSVLFLGEKRDPSEIYANSNLRNHTHITQKLSYITLNIMSVPVNIQSVDFYTGSTKRLQHSHSHTSQRNFSVISVQVRSHRPQETLVEFFFFAASFHRCKMTPHVGIKYTIFLTLTIPMMCVIVLFSKALLPTQLFGRQMMLGRW